MTEANLRNWTLRCACLEDAAVMAAVENAASQHFYGQDQTSEGRIRNWLGRGDRDLEHGVRLLLDDGGNVIGWAEVEDPGAPYVQFEGRLAIHPGFAGVAAAWDRLTDWMETRARTLFAGRAPEGTRTALTVDTLIHDADRIAAYERFGARRVRVLNRMRIDLIEDVPTPTWPAGVAVRALDPNADLWALSEASQEVFRDHWGMVEQSIEEEMRGWQEWIGFQGEDYDETLSFLAVEKAGNLIGDAAVAGFSLCRPQHPGDLRLGILGSLGVRSAWRGRGLGLALITHSFREFRNRGYQAVELFVDTGSLTGAVRLYERAGMRAVRQEFVYEKELRPGKDLVTRGP